MLHLNANSRAARRPARTAAPAGSRPPFDPASVDAKGLAGALRKAIRGEVRFDDGARGLYATDASNYRMPPIGVVLPKSADDIVAAMALCREYGAPLLSRGGGTSLAGQCCNTAVVLDLSKYYNRVLSIDPAKRLARIQPGIVLDELQKQAAEHGLIFGPDPATHNHCTLGGMVGNNSCGIHSVMAAFYGPGSRTSDNVHELEVLTYRGLRLQVGATSDDLLAGLQREIGPRGEIYRRLRALRDQYAPLIRQRYPNIPRRVSGYNLDELLPERGFNVARSLVGSESTCVTVLEATVMLLPRPKARSLLILGYPDVFSAADHVMEILEHRPIGLEGIDDELIHYMQRRGMQPHEVAILPPGNGWLYVEFGGDSKAEADDQARKLMAQLERRPDKPHMKLFDDPEEEHQMWQTRESGLGATAFVPGMKDGGPGWEDSAVPPERMGQYLREFRDLLARYDYHAALYGHFGQGCLHCRIDFDLYTDSGLKKYRAFVEEASDIVLRLGGSLSGEHGDGQARGELLPKMFGPELIQAFREFKTIWDPDWKMNPGKKIDPNPILANLRLGSQYRPWEPETFFQFPEDSGSLAHATQRCVGVGKCRRHEGGTMCPSYMVTMEEKDSTRGRAHLLFEMLQGDVIKDGWRSREVKGALDLCLACKGCKADCPVNVDLATLKAEFLAHYYRGRLRPRTAYSMGLIHRWARVASKLPRWANFFMHAPGLSNVVKFLGGIAQERELPPFARQTFKQWFFAHTPPHPNAPGVILWPDTFNNYFHPHVARAAVQVLEDAGLRVIVPRQNLCCGRPLYDYGMLKTARKHLGEILETLHDEIAADTPVIGLEPSCVAVFRDELTGLFPKDQHARRLASQTYTLSEFLLKKLRDYHPPQLPRQAVVHGHCHHKAIMKMESELNLLRRMGLDFQLLESGCCGMAGSFGFEADKYEISCKCGERSLLPAVRQAGHDTLIIADGFSCKEQIRQLAQRDALHLAELLALALDGGAQSQSTAQLDPTVKSHDFKPESVKELDARRERQAQQKGG